jgi:tight adherence protein B
MKILFSCLVFLCAAAAVYSMPYIISESKKKYSLYKNNIEKLVKGSLAVVKQNEILRLQILSAALLLLSALLLGNWILSLILAPIVFFIPKIFVSRRQKKYYRDYRQGLTAFLESLVSSLKAGLSLNRAFVVFTDRDKTPVGREVTVMLNRVNFGLSMQDAISELSERIPVRENQIVMAALSTALETGGNITEVLSNILDTIRKRDELDREVKALTSQGVMSGIVVGCLPVFLLIIITVIDPSFTAPLFTTTQGMLLLSAAAVMELIGAYLISRITKVE